MASFFGELRKRKVYRVAIVYLVAAWIVVQIASTVLPPFNVPRWVLSSLIVLLALGFPFVLAIGWAFDFTPHGLTKSADATDRSPAVQRYRGLLIAAGATVSIVLAGYWFFTHGVAVPSDNATKSVAVLPFESLSEDKQNTYFASGIQEEILTRLTKIGALKVISRASTQQYQTRPSNLAEIGRQLGATHFVEGAVQKSGEQVRINVQLIDAATDTHVWAESFDRNLTDLFGVESEVAEKIASTLKARLTGEEQEALAVKPTTNPAAYDAFLRGLAYERIAAVEPDTFRNAARLYNEAVTADPQFAVAWAHLAVMHSDMYHFGFDHTPSRLAQMKEAAETAMRLQPNLGEAHLAWGYYQYRGLHDFAAAEAAFERAQKRLPNDPFCTSAVAFVKRREAKWDEALALLDRVIDLDPRNAQVHSELGYTLLYMRQFERATEIANRGLSIAPGDSTLSALSATIRQARGDLQGARDAIGALPLQPMNTTVFDTQIMQLLLERQWPAAIQSLTAALQFPDRALGDQVGEFYVFLTIAQRGAGDEAAARATCAKGVAYLEQLRTAGVDTWYLAGCIGMLKAALGDGDGAKREGEHAMALTGPDVSAKPDVEEAIAKMDARLGRADAALGAIPRLLQTPYQKGFFGSVLTPALLRNDPAWDRLRGEPRFQQLADSK